MHICREFFPHVLPRGDQVRALFDEGVRPPRILVGDVPRHGVDVTSLFQRATSRDASAAVFSGFNNEDRERHPTDDPIADWKILGRRKTTERKFGDERTAKAENLISQS